MNATLERQIFAFHRAVVYRFHAKFQTKSRPDELAPMHELYPIIPLILISELSGPDINVT